MPEMRHRLSRAGAKPRWMRRPRAGLVTPHPGDAGPRPEALRPPARSSLTAERQDPPEAPTRGHPQGVATGSRRRDEAQCRKARPGIVRRTPQVERREAPVPSRGGAEYSKDGASLGAPFPSILRGTQEREGLPGADTKNTGEGACLFSTPPGVGEETA